MRAINLALELAKNPNASGHLERIIIVAEAVVALVCLNMTKVRVSYQCCLELKLRSLIFLIYFFVTTAISHFTDSGLGPCQFNFVCWHRHSACVWGHWRAPVALR